MKVDRLTLVVGIWMVVFAVGSSQAAPATKGHVYYVASSNSKASDTNPGTAGAPWKTIARAGKASELKPGDTVLIKGGVYREHANITVSGEPGKPITFAAAPGERVVIKGSEIIRGRWTRLSEDKGVKEPFPGDYRRIWKMKLDEEFFTDEYFKGSYSD
ncbi:MAG: hypothetical protein HY318_17260, partial [Armatimonadetes bacterium]|nr:hypothetical protein [Armatimonadota bacterium]